MRASLHLLFALPLALSAGLLGCDSGDDEGHEHDDHHGDDETGHETGHEADCEAETRDDEFAVGLAKSGSMATVTFVAADPAPPGMGDNTWTLAITDAEGNPLPDATFTAITPWMPDHDHGTPVEAMATATGNPAEFSITPVNLFMAGLWEVTLDIDAGAGTTDSVVFAFCVE